MKKLILLLSVLPGIVLAQQRWENDPNNWKNSPQNWENSSQNWRNSPQNWENSPNNYFSNNGIYNERGDRIGYERQGAVRNFYDNEGNRRGYR